ncbi:MAG: CmcI family methyltransferase [Pseudomonadales bacterium]|nr:CmcI family methyltransferase [Pseudomonadales bacterium]
MIRIDMENGWVVEDDGAGGVRHELGSPEGFALVSKVWLRAGWDAKYVYSFSWMGRPIIQLPDDMLRIQEVIYAHRPTLIIETGVAHGGSLIYYASLFKAMGIPGRVVGIDIEIRPHNRTAIEAHELFPYLTLLEGSSVAPEIVAQVKSLIRPDDRVMVILDSNHSKAHVHAELEAYGDMVSSGCYIVATDGIMHWLGNAQRTQADWTWNNPRDAAADYLQAHPEFEMATPVPPFNEGVVTEPVTYWPGAWLRKR